MTPKNNNHLLLLIINPMNPYLIVLADDHDLFRERVKTIIDRVEGLKVAGEVAVGIDLMECFNKLQPNLVILDITMPNLRVIEIAKEIKTFFPETKVIIITIDKYKEFMNQVIPAGVDGLLIKENADKEILFAIEMVRQGRKYIPPSLSKELTDILLKNFQENGLEHFRTLTPREKEIASLVAEGMSSKEIAKLFSISARTVEKHRHNISGKLQIKKIADISKFSFIMKILNKL